MRKADDEGVLISDLDVGARTGSLHFKRTFTPAFSLDTGPSFHVRGERPDFDSCLRQPATEAWESQQQQIRTTIGLQVGHNIGTALNHPRVQTFDTLQLSRSSK